MPYAGLDTAAVARALALLADRPGDLADAYFERLEEVEAPSAGDAPGVRWRREEGLAVRLLRGSDGWCASRDEMGSAAFAEAVRQVARSFSRTAFALPGIGEPPPPASLDESEDGAAEVLRFAGLVEKALRERRVAFPLRLATRRHRRRLQVVGPRLVGPVEEERFYSVTAELPWARCGALLPALGAAAAGELADRLLDRFRAREAPPPAVLRAPVVLGPAAAAVFLHEAVAHALEVDTLAVGGRAENALGLVLGPPLLNVLDDPAAAPPGLLRRVDDEGAPVVQRWLLRQGTVEQLLCDRAWAAGSERLEPGAGRRSGRHDTPAPRSCACCPARGSSTTSSPPPKGASSSPRRTADSSIP